MLYLGEFLNSRVTKNVDNNYVCVLQTLAYYFMVKNIYGSNRQEILFNSVT